jgi:hypothetical protein
MLKKELNIELVCVFGLFGANASTLSGSTFLITFLLSFLLTESKKLEKLPNCPKARLLTSRGSLVRIH